MERLRYICTVDDSGLEVLTLLRREFRVSTNLLRQLKVTENGIMLDDTRVTVRHTVQPGQELSILREPESGREGRVEPCEGPLDIVYEDGDLMILNKPAGLAVHPSPGHYDGDTLGNRVVYHLTKTGQNPTFRAINRLDRGTSGLMTCAKNKLSAHRLEELLAQDGIIAARDKIGRLPVVIGKGENGCCVSMESFACQKLGYAPCYNLGPGEIVKITADGYEQLAAPGDKMKICAFLWSYYGYPNSNYEGRNVEVMRCRNGEIMAKAEMENGTMPDVDYVAGIPDSGVPHAIGYANHSHKPFARPFVKYTPTWARSFTPSNQEMRNLVAEMKQIPVPELIEDKKLMFLDDSIVRGTQLNETVKFLYDSGAKEVHMRSACPPIMYGCKYLNFSRSNSEMELLARRTIQKLEGDEGQKHIAEYADGKTERGKCLLKAICEEMGFDSLGYQSIDGLLEAIGLDRSKVCTYCWTGEE